MKDIYHIIRDFYSAPWVMPRGWTYGYRGGLGGQKIFFFEIQPDLVYKLLTWMAHALAHFFGSPLGPWGGGGQKFNFLNMVMWHITLKGMSSRPGYTEKL